jgi:hypothetical protein
MGGKRILIGALAALLILGACAGSDDSSVGAADGDGGGAAGGADTATAQKRSLSEYDGIESTDDTLSVAQSDVATTSSELPGLGPAIIKTAHLELEVERDELQAAIDDAVAIANESGGFLLSTRLENEKSGHGTIVLRIPAERFETALSSLDDLGDVEQRTISGEDVSEEFVDLEARLRNFEAQEAVLLQLMDRSKTVTDTIRVQQHLSTVQLDIERIRGRLRFLEDQTTLGTITLTMREAGVVVAKDTTLDKAWARAGDAALSVVSGVIVGLGFVIPISVLLVLVLLGLKLLRPRFNL